MPEDLEAPFEKPKMPASLKDWAAVIRDLGLILGVPTVIAVGIGLYDLQDRALQAQVKANEAQIKVLEAQNSALKDTQYDRALSIIKSQKELFESERDGLLGKIKELQTVDPNSANSGPSIPRRLLLIR